MKDSEQVFKKVHPKDVGRKISRRGVTKKKNKTEKSHHYKPPSTLSESCLKIQGATPLPLSAAADTHGLSEKDQIVQVNRSEKLNSRFASKLVSLSIRLGILYQVRFFGRFDGLSGFASN